jgi:hypothetical protein
VGIAHKTKVKQPAKQRKTEQNKLKAIIPIRQE